MTGNETRADSSKAVGQYPSEVCTMETSRRPYYWSWYGTVFDEPDLSREAPAVHPEVGR